MTDLPTSADKWPRVLDLCSVCAGTGVPLSGPGCICGGRGTMTAELEGFRRENYNLRATSATYAPLVEAVKEWQEARKAIQQEIESGTGDQQLLNELGEAEFAAEDALAALPLPEVTP